MALALAKRVLAMLVATAAVLVIGSSPAPYLTSGSALVAGRVTIIGDSVTIDAKPNLLATIRGAVIYARLDEQWYQGVAYARQLVAKGRLGTVVVVALGSNGPITASSMSAMMHVLSVCRRVVLVTDHVPFWWQGPNNRRLRAAATTYKDVVIADWASLAAAHPGWFYPDGVHMPIGGPGARAFARLVGSKV